MSDQNPRPNSARTGGQILIDQLRAQGTEMVFCVPGESYLAALDAFHDAPDIELIVCRQEGGAAMMADAYGKLTGRPGVVFVTRGPGATNASAGIHIAHQDSTPVVMFIGQVGRDMSEREAFQEIDYRRMFGQMSKWVAEIDDPGRIPEFVGRAYQTAVSGRPGPVVLSLPEDMLREPATVGDSRRFVEVQSAPRAEDMQDLRRLLLAAERPFAIIGGGGWDAASIADFKAFAAAFDLPVGASFRCQSHFDGRLEQYAGDVGVGINPKLAARIQDADLILAVGARLGEATTSGYTLLKSPVPDQKLIHVYPDPEELGRVYQPNLAVLTGMKTFAAAAAALDPPSSVAWTAWRAAARQDYLENSKPLPVPGDVQYAEIVTWLSDNLPDDAIITTGAGNYAAWVNKNYRFRDYRTLIGPTSGSMGYGVPAAVAAKLLHPERTVVSFAGDGCFMMNGQELATAVHQRADFVLIVVNNGMYGTIRAHQERDYPGRVSGTALHNPDFAALARAYGAHGEVVEKTADFYPAFERAQAAGVPAVIELRVDPEAISPRATITNIRDAALARATA